MLSEEDVSHAAPAPAVKMARMTTSEAMRAAFHCILCHDRAWRAVQCSREGALASEHTPVRASREHQQDLLSIPVIPSLSIPSLASPKRIELGWGVTVCARSQDYPGSSRRRAGAPDDLASRHRKMVGGSATTASCGRWTIVPGCCGNDSQIMQPIQKNDRGSGQIAVLVKSLKKS